MTPAQYEKLMRILGGEYGGIARELQRQLKPGTSAEGTADYAEGFSTKAIQCLMAGMEGEAMELLAKSDEWMTPALVRATAGEGIELEYTRHFRHAVCRWLVGPPVVAHDLTRACQLLQAAEAMTPTRSDFDRDYVIPLWLGAGRYAECVSTYQQSGAKYPPPRKRQHNQAAMAYLLARERLHPVMPEPDIQKRLHPFLKEQVPTLLNLGQEHRFALWVQIITRAEAGAPARAAIRQVADQYA